MWVGNVAHFMHKEHFFIKSRGAQTKEGGYGPSVTLTIDVIAYMYENRSTYRM